MNTTGATCVLRSEATLAESPFWDVENHALWWVDIEGRTIHRFDPQTRANKSYYIGERVGALVLRKNGSLLLATEIGVANFDPRTEAFEVLCNPDDRMDQTRFNDGKCDPDGRLWAGTMGLASTSQSSGSLYSFDSRFQIRTHLKQVGVSNGMAWSRDAKTLFYVDSLSRTVDAFDYDRTSVAIENRRPIFTVPEEFGIPDGMAIDSNDKLWIAFWGGWCVAQIDPFDGKLLQKISLPVAQVTSCAFGGKDLTALYITTARYGLDDTEVQGQPEAGSIFVAQLPVGGLAPVLFRD